MKKWFCLMLSIVLLISLGFFAFAKGNVLPGDVDGNGKVQAEDARLALRASVGLEEYKSDSNAFTAADVNKDGFIKADDARKILRAAVGLESLDSSNEFDYLHGGNFYLKGTMTDSYGQSVPLEMAVTADSLYMLSDFDGAAIGILINDDATYMIYPAGEAYLELSPAVMEAMGTSADDLISSADLDYSQYDLAKADATFTEKVNGVNCTVYVFNNSYGSIRFFMNGNKLVRFASYDAKGAPDVISDVSYITDQVPADKIDPPANYKGYKGLTGMFSFVSLLGDMVDE